MINSYCTDEITILQWNGIDSWNEPESATEITVKGYVEYKTRRVVDIRGEERVSSCRIYLPKRKTDAALGRALRHEDRIWIGGESFNRAIIAIAAPKAFNLPHYEVDLA